MRVLVWHVHGGYLDALLRGEHDWVLPLNPSRDSWGRGRAGRRWTRAREVEFGRLRSEALDAVILQRPEEIDLVHSLTGLRAGRDLPAVYLEHNTPRVSAVDTRHPLAERSDIPIVHVTHVNQLLWDNGRAPTVVIEHGIPDPGYQYSGELERVAAVINEPVRRGRISGTDLLPRFAAVAPVDVFGMGGEELAAAVPSDIAVTAAGDLPTAHLHAELARRRVYLHPFRWTSLGLSLLEAMHLGMPVLALAMTDAPHAVPADAGLVSADLEELRSRLRLYLADSDLARLDGVAARRHALERYALAPFLQRWDGLLHEIAHDVPGSRSGHSPLERSTV